MAELINQPTAKTARKVRNAAWSAAWVAPVAAIGSGVVTDLWLPEMAAYHMHFEVLTVMSITGVGTWIAGYQTKERA